MPVYISEICTYIDFLIEGSQLQKEVKVAVIGVLCTLVIAWK